MIINRNFKDFKFRHRSNKNQIIYTSKKVKNDDEVINLIDNFLIEKNSFIFESVEKGKIKGRYTIFGKNPDKIWEFNNNNSFLIKNNKKIKLKEKPDQLIEKIIEEFKFETPKKLPKICSLISFLILTSSNTKNSGSGPKKALSPIPEFFKNSSAFFAIPLGSLS